MASANHLRATDLYIAEYIFFSKFINNRRCLIIDFLLFFQMAEYLASIFGTEKDKVNCSFYFKIGACRHGERCSRIHNKPTFSQTIVLQNLYINPQNSAKSADGSHLANVSDEEMQVDNKKDSLFPFIPPKNTLTYQSKKKTPGNSI